jgi:chorismate mutase / prephenate dehydratase
VTLEQLRKKIDRIDRQLLQLLNRRASLALQIGRWKRRKDRPIFDGNRENAVLRRTIRSNGGPLSAPAVRAIFREILRTSRRLQKKG